MLDRGRRGAAGCLPAAAIGGKILLAAIVVGGCPLAAAVWGELRGKRALGNRKVADKLEEVTNRYVRQGFAGPAV